MLFKEKFTDARPKDGRRTKTDHNRSSLAFGSGGLKCNKHNVGSLIGNYVWPQCILLYN